MQMIFTDFGLLKNLWTGKLSPHVVKNTLAEHYVVPKYIHFPPPPPTEGTFSLEPHPSVISIPGGACPTPPPPHTHPAHPLELSWNCRNFSTWLGTPWKEYIKNAFALYYLAKFNCFCKKNPFIHVNTVCNNLNFALWWWLYAYRLKFWLFYDYRLIFLVTVNKKVKN